MTSAAKPLLLDNCAISACFNAGGWGALVGRYRLETVEEVAIEAATGFQNRDIIDPAEFRKQVVVHGVSREERLSFGIENSEAGGLDDGERDLWVHALGRQDAWVLCGPDTASIRFGVRAGYGDRLVSLEELFEVIGFKPTEKLKEHHKKKWLREVVERFSTEIALERVSEQTRQQKKRTKKAD